MLVPRATVINVLGKVLKNTNISFLENGTSVIIVKEGIPEVYILPETVPYKMLQRLQHKYDVKIELFFHPEMCHDESPKSH